MTTDREPVHVHRHGADPLQVEPVEEPSRRFAWAGWLAHMGSLGRLYWIVVSHRLPYEGLAYRMTGRLRWWGADRYVRAYMAWKAADYQPWSWPR